MRLKLIHIIGSFLGYVFYYLLPFRRKHIVSSMRLAFKHEKTDKEIRAMALKNYQHYGKLFCEYFAFNSKNTLQYVEFKNLEIGEAALKKGKGVLLLAAHLGNFELSLKSGLLLPYDFSMVVRPIKNKLAHFFINRFRTKYKLNLIAAKNTYYAILSLLRQNKVVGFVLDQHKGTRGINVDFFGRRAATNTALAALALETGATVIPIYNFRKRDGRFIIQLGEPLEMIQTGNREFDIFYNTQIFTKKIEELVRRSPEQWFWMHKRWKGVDNKKQRIHPVIPFTPDAYKNFFLT
ncbi:MAG TPA: lysophospholipid acyltransferase family protein [Bdellovibrionota bacterium]|nr:lysophospholipid acyltransferase family protein [Bdellovibrionota bacterium]